MFEPTHVGCYEVDLNVRSCRLASNEKIFMDTDVALDHLSSGLPIDARQPPPHSRVWPTSMNGLILPWRSLLSMTARSCSFTIAT